METIFIPRLSVFRRDKNVLFDLARFCAVTGFTRTTPPDQELSRKGNIVGRILNTLRAAILSKTSKNRKEYEVLSEENDLECTKADTLLSFKSQRELKQVLLNLICKHETAMSMVGKARKACCSAEEKLNDFNQTMRNEDLILPMKHGEKAKRIGDLKEMHLKLAMHKAVFENLFASERSLRETIQKLAINLEIEVVMVIAAAIRNLMNVHKQTISEAEVAKLAAKLYEDNCRGYRFQVVENDACQKVAITKPMYVKTVIKL